MELKLCDREHFDCSFNESTKQDLLDDATDSGDWMSLGSRPYLRLRSPKPQTSRNPKTKNTKNPTQSYQEPKATSEPGTACPWHGTSCRSEVAAEAGSVAVCRDLGLRKLGSLEI